MYVAIRADYHRPVSLYKDPCPLDVIVKCLKVGKRVESLMSGMNLGP